MRLLCKVRDYRVRHSLTQAELAAAAGVSRQTIVAIEKGRYDPSLPLAFTLARVFQCKIEDLFEPLEAEE